jgi:hypothetical protein
MHYLFHVLLALLAGVFFTTTFWALSLRRWALRNAQWPEAMWHGHTALKLLSVALALLAVLWAVPVRCQPLADSRLGKWHDLPPAMNVVNAGFLLEHGATTRRDATYVALAGLAVGAVMYTQNAAVGLTIGTLSVGYSIRLNLRSCKSQRTAARLLQLGYRAEYLYDVVPDSIDAHPHLRIIRR